MPNLTKKTSLHAKNTIHEQARKRVLEVGRASAEDWFNSNFVEAYPIYYFSKVTSGIECSCHGMSMDEPFADSFIQNRGDDAAANSSGIASGKSGRKSSTFTISSGNNQSVSPADNILDQPPLTEELANEDNGVTDLGSANFLSSLYEDGIDCAICLRSGVQPAYDIADGQRVVLTTLNHDAIRLAELHNADLPASFSCFQNGYVVWTLKVPKYFERCRVQIYNNNTPVDGTITDDSGNALSLSILRAAAGGNLSIRVTADFLTHVTFEFDFAVAKPLLASLPQLQRLKNYSRFISIPTTNIVLENRVQCSIHDLIWCPSLNLMWKVTEINPIRLVDSYHVGWTLQARIVQPLESSILTFPVTAKALT